MEIRAKDPAHALRQFCGAVLGDLEYQDVEVRSRASRVGHCISVMEPVTTIYERPAHRVMLNKARDPNPFFHLFESLWMLAGRNDVRFVAYFVKRMAEFSDDGKTLHGAYGWRWISFFTSDQIENAIDTLHQDPTTRRCVVTMWDPYRDPIRARNGGKDVPCNTQIYFDLRDGERLNMSVTCRSNDALWGAYGANVVHFSVLMEYVLQSLRLRGSGELREVVMGRYTQFSHDMHVYTNHFPDARLREIQQSPVVASRPCRPLFETALEQRAFLHDLRHLDALLMGVVPRNTFKSAYFNEVVIPMRQVWLHRRPEDLEKILCEGWVGGAYVWLHNRIKGG
jgi:thymidylate synthase